MSVIPFRPTADKTGYPTACLSCGRHAHGIGIGDPRRDPHYLCPECMALLTQIKDISNWNGFERAAVGHAIDAVGPFIEEYGPDMGAWEQETIEEFVRAIWASCGDGVREAVKNGAPF
jgi:hypothetical protein